MSVNDPKATLWDTLVGRLYEAQFFLSREGFSYLFARKDSDYSWREVVWCRLRSHPAGIVYYNASGWEPDYTCKGCGDDLG